MAFALLKYINNMHNIMQNIAVALIIICSLAYIIYRIKTTFEEVESGCYGCKGCALKKQMMKNRRKKTDEHGKRECFTKKN